MIGIAILAFAVLIPIVPAYLLFKALPSTAQMTGPFQGLQIKLGGAFAGYCCVVLILFHYHNLWSPYQVWQFRGEIVNQDGTPLEAIDANDLTIQPPRVQAPGSGRFSVVFDTSTGSGGQTEFPSVVIAHPEYRERVISLDPNDPPSDLQLERDYSTYTITAHKIVLSKLPDYRASAPPLTAAAQIH